MDKMPMGQITSLGHYFNSCLWQPKHFQNFLLPVNGGFWVKVSSFSFYVYEVCFYFFPSCWGQWNFPKSVGSFKD